MMRYCFLLLVSLVILNTSLSSGYTSRVDGKEGWPVKPSSGYNVLTSGIKLLIHDNICKSYPIFHFKIWLKYIFGCARR